MNRLVDSIPPESLTARQLTVSFPGSAVAPVMLPSRDVIIPAGSTRHIGLKGTGAILQSMLLNVIIL